jgi:hypothetical protein
MSHVRLTAKASQQISAGFHDGADIVPRMFRTRKRWKRPLMSAPLEGIGPAAVHYKRFLCKMEQRVILHKSVTVCHPERRVHVTC